MTAFSAIDLSRLPSPQIIASLDYEAVRGAILERFRARALAAGMDYDAIVESDPVVILIEAAAYEVLLNRATGNDDARSILLAYATGADLDHLASNIGVARRIIDPGDADAVPPVLPILESDADLRTRVQLAPEAWTNAGTEPAYIFHALEVGGVIDATATSPAPGVVEVTVLGTDHDTPTALVAAVQARLGDEDVRQLTDQVVVQAATVIPAGIVATVTFYPGPAVAPILVEARDRLDRWLARQARIGHDITRSGILAALHIEGVQNVVLSSPAADIVCSDSEVVHVQAVTVTELGRDV